MYEYKLYFQSPPYRFGEKPVGDSPRNHLVAVDLMPRNRKDKEGVNTEVFDPYISSTLDVLAMKNIFINGERVLVVDQTVKVIAFHNIDKDGFSYSKGRVNHIFLNGKQVK